MEGLPTRKGFGGSFIKSFLPLASGFCFFAAALAASIAVAGFMGSG
jgi:hypothetical protein